jgi:F-type H+-transporting ATPase subunit alpha
VFDNPIFAKLVGEGRPSGEVIGVDRFLITVNGLGEVGVNALVYFSNGHAGLVREVREDVVMVLNITQESIPLGTLAVIQADEIITGVGDKLMGRVISVLGQPLDGKGPLTYEKTRPVFTTAPGIIERQAVSDPLTTGVAIADQLFPLVKGQRIAVLGDNKVGKTAFTTQLTLAQKGTGRVVFNLLI